MYENIINSLPYPSNRIITILLEGIQTIDLDLLLGLYITGSIPLDDFYANKSDIDFVAICKTQPTDEIIRKLKKLHQHISSKKNKPNLNGIYTTANTLYIAPMGTKEVLTYNNKQLSWQRSSISPVLLHELKYTSIHIYGLRTSDLPIQITPFQLNQYIYENVQTYWQKWISDSPNSFKKKMLIFIFPRFTEWTILGVGRQLCTLKTGKVVSKTQAGILCQQILPNKFYSFLELALQIRKSERRYPIVKTYAIRPSIKRYRNTIECLRYMISEINQHAQA